MVLAIIVMALFSDFWMGLFVCSRFFEQALSVFLIVTLRVGVHVCTNLVLSPQSAFAQRFPELLGIILTPTSAIRRCKSRLTREPLSIVLASFLLIRNAPLDRK